MENKTVQKLIESRKAIKKKFQDLQTNVIHSENYLERKFKPIADPLKELLHSVKNDSKRIKTEQDTIKDEHITPQGSSTPNKKKLVSETTPALSNISNPLRRKHRLQFLDTENIATHEPEELMHDTSSENEFSHIIPEKIRNEIEQSEIFQNYIDPYSGLAKEYISGAYLDVKKIYDTTYGPKIELKTGDDGVEYDTGKWLLGKSYIDFSSDGKTIRITTPDGKMFDYTGSLPLYELIFKTVPNRAVVDNNTQAIQDYKDILNRTNVHRMEYDPNKHIKGNSGRKYQEFVKPILEGIYGEQDITPSSFRKPPRYSQLRPRTKSLTYIGKKGKGYLNFNNKNVEYVPYKDANTIVNRLKILIGSQVAGNTSHNNEILYIIEELKRNKIIK